MFIIAGAGILGWLLMLGIALSLGAAAKRGDELELRARRYLPPHLVDDGPIIPLDAHGPGCHMTCVHASMLDQMRLCGHEAFASNRAVISSAASSGSTRRKCRRPQSCE